MDVTFLWDEDDDPRGNVAQLRWRGLTKDDVEHAVEYGATDPDVSNMSGWPVLYGPAEDGRAVQVSFRWEDLETIYVLDAQAES
jgi:hypothetical protein